MSWLAVVGIEFYGQSFSWEADAQGIIAVTGPNGAGKSTTFNEPIAWALYGKTLRGTSPGPNASVELHLGDLKVIRNAKSGLTWEYQGKVVKLTEGVRKAQAELNDLLRLDFEAWRKASVFSTYDPSRFSDATDSDRKALIESMLGLGAFEVGVKALREELREKRTGAQRIKTAIEGLQAQLDTATGDLESALDEVESLTETVVDAGADQATEIEAAEAALAVATAAQQTATANAATAAAEHKRVTEDRQKLQREYDQARRAEPLAECSACGRAFEGVEEAVEHAVQEQRRLSEALRLAGVAASNAATAIQTTQTAARQANRAHSDALTLLQDLRTIQASQAGVAAARAEAIERADARVSTLTERVEALRAKLAAAQVSKARADEVVVVFEAAEKVLGLGGARNALFTDALAMLQQAINDVFDHMDWPVQGEFQSWTEKKTGGVSEKLAFKLVGIGAEAYEGASGGERRRVDAAFVLALADIYRDTCPVKLPLMFDDTFDTLDPDGVASVARVLRMRSADRPIIVISQSPELVARCKPEKLFSMNTGEQLVDIVRNIAS